MEHSNGNLQKLFIVVIDDSETVCRLLESLLTKEGHQAKSFLNPVSALRSIKTGETSLPDLFFVDVTLPHIDGYEVVKFFKGNPASMHIPIIMISRSDDTVLRLKARLARATAYMTKPFQIPELMALVRSVATAPRPNPHEK